MNAIVESKKSISEVFGVEESHFKSSGAQMQIAVYPPSEQTPEPIDGFLFQPDTLRRILVWMASGRITSAFAKAKMKRNLMIYGPTGCGKTAMMQQFCAVTGRAMFRYQCNEDTEQSQLFGSWKLCQAPTPEDSSRFGTEMVFVDGPVLRWARTPNSILLLDEFDQLPPSVAMSLNGILDGADILVPETGEKIKIAKGCLVVATGNTNGRGSAGGNGGSAALYKGVKRQNIASIDRFFVINATYLSEDEEIRLLQDQAKMPAKAAEAMAKLASSVRTQFLGLNEDAGAQGHPLEFTITTRNLLNWALSHRLMIALGLEGPKAFAESLSMTLLDFGTEAERDAILDTWANILGES